MSTEQETVLAKMARLQGTIDERRKHLGQVQHPNAATRHNPTSMPDQIVASSQLTGSSPTLMIRGADKNYRASGPLEPFSSRPAVPIVTKTTWQLTAPACQSTTAGLRGKSRGSKKLILNKPGNTLQPKPSIRLHVAVEHPPASTLPSPSVSTQCTTLRATSAHFIPSVSTQSLSVSTPPTLEAPASTLKNTSLAAVAFSNPLPENQTLSTSTQPPPSAAASTSSRWLSPHTQTTSNLKSMKLRPAPVDGSLAPFKLNEVLIDGVSFVRDPRGKKLVRKADHSTPTGQPSAGPTTTPCSALQPTANSTPIKASIGGAIYVRTKSGNLIALSALKKFQSQKTRQAKTTRLLTLVGSVNNKDDGLGSYEMWDPNRSRTRGLKGTKISRPPLMKKNEQCRFFAKTGTCRKGLTCVYQHKPLQVAICPRFLRHRCPHSANLCPLSHQPNPHNMEHCSHFPRCTKADCPYPHVKPSSSHICREFADLGWCWRGLECGDRHVRECSEFSSKGICSNPGCRLPHVINRNQNDTDGDEGARFSPPEDAGGALFFTDVKGKRKANESSDSRISDQPPYQAHCDFKGISHNSEVTPPLKRLKHDNMAGNEDFVMFVSSEEEEEVSEEGHVDDDVASSVDSEELNSVLLHEYPDSGKDEQPPSILSPAESAGIARQPAIISKRPSFGAKEEIEDGEIFDDDDDTEDKGAKDDFGDSSGGEDEDENIEQQLLGHRRLFAKS